MVRQLVLLTFLALPLMTGTVSDCTSVDMGSGVCDFSAQNTGTEVQLGGSTTVPGVDDILRGSAPEFSGPDSSSPFNTCDYIVSERCRADSPHDPAAATPTVTLADIAAFRPEPGADRMQPNGWAIIGLDTNFYADTARQVVHGSLLGRPAAVRFTPVGYHWNYGDGATLPTANPGAPWITEFDPTPTSHVFERPGSYVVDLTISYAAEYQFAGLAWAPVAGTIALPTAPLPVTVGDAKTVLVTRDCAASPRGPGC